MLNLTAQDVSSNGEVFESQKAEAVGDVIKPHRMQA